jgi:hypothetical protein
MRRAPSNHTDADPQRDDFSPRKIRMNAQPRTARMAGAFANLRTHLIDECKGA